MLLCLSLLLLALSVALETDLCLLVSARRSLCDRHSSAAPESEHSSYTRYNDIPTAHWHGPTVVISSVVVVTKEQIAVQNNRSHLFCRYIEVVVISSVVTSRVYCIDMLSTVSGLCSDQALATMHTTEYYYT